MHKVLAVARAEYLIATTSKAFLAGVVMMPIFMGGAILVQYLTKDQVDLTPRKVAIVDETGQLYAGLAASAKQRNLALNAAAEQESEEGQRPQAPFHLEEVSAPAGASGEVDLSARVKADELFAFAVIEEGVWNGSPDATIRYHSQTPSYRALPNWLGEAVSQHVKQHRAEDLGLSAEEVAHLSRPTPLRMFGLVTLGADGQAEDAQEADRVTTFAVPFAGLMLMFMMVMSVAPAMLNNVLEEKLQKISEFLISSITPFQLMLGKLIGAVGIGLTLSAIYLGAAYGLAVYFDFADRVPPSLYVWFLFFLLNALIIFGALFSAVGAACSEIRDAQSLMTPVMLLVIIPMMCMGPIFDSPTSTFSRVASLVPPATPMLMFARLAIPPGPQMWEIALGSALSLLFAAGSVWAAGKVFRIGILSQGQAPTFAKLLRWVLTP